MNIFATSKCPVESAKFLDTKRVIKMILESTQILCSTINIRAGFQLAKYKTTHAHHPCTIWAGRTISNWTWLHQHAIALANEYSARRGKQHACLDVLNDPQLFNYASDWIPPGGLEVHENCARNLKFGADYTDVGNVYLAYQLYLNDRWDSDKLTPVWD